MTRIARIAGLPGARRAHRVPKVATPPFAAHRRHLGQVGIAAIAAISLLAASPTVKALEELERLTDETIQSACHGYVLHDLTQRLAAWFGKDSPLCQRVARGEPPREVLAELRRQGEAARGGNADFRTLPQRIDMECDNDVLCMRERRRAETAGHPLSMAVYEHVRGHCQSTWPEGVYGCIERALGDWPEVRLDRAVRMLPLAARFVTQAETALRREPAEAASVTAQLHINRPLAARSRSEDGRWLEVRDELSGATGFVLTSQVARADAAPPAFTGTAAGSGTRTGSGQGRPAATPHSLDIDALVQSGQIARQHQSNEARRIIEQRRAEEARLEAERQHLARQQAEREHQERERAERLARQQREAMQAAQSEAQRQQNMNALLTGVQSLTQDMTTMRQQQHAQSQQAQREINRLSGLSSQSTPTFGPGESGSTTTNPPRAAASSTTTATSAINAAEMCRRMGGGWTGSSCALGNVASGAPTVPDALWNSASGGSRPPEPGGVVQLDSNVMSAIAAQRSRTPIRPNAFDARGRGSARDCDRYSDMQLITMCFHASAAFLEYEKAAFMGSDQAQQDRLYAAHETTVDNLLRLVDW